MRKGFTITETVVVLGIIAVLLAFLLPVVPRLFQGEKNSVIISDLGVIKKGILGDPAATTGKVRTSFGYIGDMGTLPANLADLVARGSQPVYAFDQGVKTGAGWQGPYIQVKDGAELPRDPYGRAYLYDRTPYLSPDTGGQVIARLMSAGPDGLPNTSDDVKIELLKSESFAQVTGVVKDLQGGAVPNFRMTLAGPRNGSLAGIQAVTDAQGRFSFSDVPFGNQSLVLSPQLLTEPKSAFVTRGILEFLLTNYARGVISLSSVQITIRRVPPVYFGAVLVNGVAVWDYQSHGQTRAMSGQVLPLSQGIAMAGSNLPVDPWPLTVQSPNTQIPDLIAGNSARGQTVKITIQDFRDSAAGGNPVDVASVPFEVAFNDGSIVLFTPAPRN